MAFSSHDSNQSQILELVMQTALLVKTDVDRTKAWKRTPNELLSRYCPPPRARHGCESQGQDLESAGTVAEASWLAILTIQAILVAQGGLQWWKGRCPEAD